MAEYNRILPALLSPTSQPRSPHVVADIRTLLVERGYSASVVSVNFDAGHFCFVVDGTPISIRAGSPQDNTATEMWYFVCNSDRTNGFVRANVAKVLRNAPFRFEDLSGNPAFPMQAVAKSWYRVWPNVTSTWEAFSRDVLKCPSTVVETRDFVYVDEAAIVSAIDLLLAN